MAVAANEGLDITGELLNYFDSRPTAVTANEG